MSEQKGMEKWKERKGMKAGKEKKTKGKRGLRYLLSAMVLVALVGTGCGKEEGEEKTLTSTPYPSGITPTVDALDESEEGQGASNGGTSQTGDLAQAGESQEAEGTSPTEDGGQGADIVADFPIVTPLPQKAVADIADSIAPKDYPVVDGSTATLPLSQALYCYATGEDAAEAEKAIVHTKTTNSYYRLYNGEADLLIVYEPPQEIIERMKSEELLIKPVGLDALVFMANEGNPVQSLTKKQLVDIYSGKIKNWRDVGGSNISLLAFQRPEGSGSQTLMQKLVMGDVAMEDGDNVFRYSTMADILEGMTAYSGDANTLGYSVFYYANFMYSLPELRFMGVDGVMPSTQSIYDGSYPFVNAFYAVIRPDEPEDSDARRLFDWLTGQDGQQMVLDLGYVPVMMPEGAQIVEKEANQEGEPQVTPAKNLEPGQHFIFVQKEPAPTTNLYGDIWIYDENWDCTASFKMARCIEAGVTDARYIAIRRWKAQGEEAGGEDTLYIYDLEEGEFVDFSGIDPGEIVVLDGKKGYFKAYDSSGAKVIDRFGNVLLDWVPYLEDEVMLYREGDCYCASYWGGYLDNNIGGIQKIYDLDFHLKTIIYDLEEDMPPERERVDGVAYVWGENGCILSREGEPLLTQELFLEVFGNGADTECTIETGNLDWETQTGARWLYKVTYAGQTWYVDTARNAYIKEGENRLTILDAQKAGEGCYVAQMKDGKKYFLANGEPLKAITFEEEPDDIRMCEDGSYIVVKNMEQGYLVEMVVPEDDFCSAYQYESSKVKYTSMECLEPYVVAMKGSRYAQDGERQEQLVIYKKSRIEVFEAEKLSLAQIGSWKTNQYVHENVWLVTKDNGGEQTLTGGRKRKFYTYGVIIGGMLRFTTPVPGECVDAACHDGYLQINAGSYTYVYDYNGNQIIKAYNWIVMEE